MNNNKRDIVVKTFLGPDEFLALEHHCKAADVSQSRAIRELVKGLLHGTNRSGQMPRSGRPKQGQHMALLPSRRCQIVPLRL